MKVAKKTLAKKWLAKPVSEMPPNLADMRGMRVKLVMVINGEGETYEPDDNERLLSNHIGEMCKVVDTGECSLWVRFSNRDTAWAVPEEISLDPAAAVNPSRYGSDFSGWADRLIDQHGFDKALENARLSADNERRSGDRLMMEKVYAEILRRQPAAKVGDRILPMTVTKGSRSTKLERARSALDRALGNAKFHCYKPIQVAEILNRHRLKRNFDLGNYAQYKNESRTWRDEVSRKLVGNVSTSNVAWQESLFTQAKTPEVLASLGDENLKRGGIIEAYIYRRLRQNVKPISDAIDFCDRMSRAAEPFHLPDFLDRFRNDEATRRCTDKIFEIAAFAILSAIVARLEPTLEMSGN